MNLFTKMIRKFFLIKEIVSKEGEVHFRRYRVLITPWFDIYLHHILKSDQDKDMHDHPFSFKSLILSGAYQEICERHPDFSKLEIKEYLMGDVVSHCGEDIHKISLLTDSVWTLVFASKHYRMWGYRFNKDKHWIDFDTYRRLKNKKDNYAK
jgi:hypothetical protein